ncbi:AAA family ATPase [Noviherbaspirillum sp. 1P10PC]|uniref:AAA family ATPase n=1 Tax=Noviherbaspirillum sp. 1P10PC TaxID=3132292 RepID=UPI00399F07CE
MNTENTPSPLSTFSITTPSSTISVEVKSRNPIFILGRNGTGKSALVHDIFGKLGHVAVYIPGSRPSYFDNESLSLTPATRRNLTNNLRSWDSSPDTRWKSISGTSRNEKAIHDLQAAEVQYKIDAANDIKIGGADSPAIARLQSNNSPLDRVNAILAQANLPVQVIIEKSELMAERSGNVYSIAKMSDGERAALVFAAEVVAAPDKSIFLVDEPELHLHRSIVVPLLNALIAERNDCGFIVSTHELELPGDSLAAKMILVRGSDWQGNAVRAWDVDLLDNSELIPESLRTDLIGSRRKILFIEGTSLSLDKPLYALLFPSVSVRSRENCREVMRAVAGLRSIESLHRAQAFGLIDHDGMDHTQLTKLESEGIFPLSIFSVESLYYSAEVLLAIASQQSHLLGVPADQLLTEAKNLALSKLKTQKSVEHLASRISERQMRDKLLLAMPDRQAMIEGKSSAINVSISSPYPAELGKIQGFIETGNIEGIVSRYPVRESGVLDGLANGMRFISRQDYEKAVLVQIASNNDLKKALIDKLGKLATLLL